MNIESIWNETLTQLAAQLPDDDLARLRAECSLASLNGNGQLVLRVFQMDTLNLIKHRYSRHLATYLRLAAGHDVELSLEYAGTGTPAMRHFLKVLTAHYILSSKWPEPTWAIPDLLPAGLTLLAGRQKVGKSWLALQLCRAVAYGHELWERPVPQGSFLYLALEDNPRRLQSRMQKQGWDQTEALRQSGFVMRDQFEDQIGFLDDEGANILAQQIESQKPRLVIIDTLGRAVRGDVNDYEIMTAALGPIQAVALRTNTAIMILDHHRKLFGGDIDVVVDILGSSAKAAVADTIWGMYRKKGSGKVVLGMVGRDVEDRQFYLQMDPAAGLWHLDQEGDSLEITPRRQEILDALDALGEASLGDVAAAIEQNRGNTYTRLQDLVQAGLIERRATAGQAVTYLINREEQQ